MKCLNILHCLYQDISKYGFKLRLEEVLLFYIKGIKTLSSMSITDLNKVSLFSRLETLQTSSWMLG